MGHRHFISRQPVIPPYHALLGGLDPIFSRCRVLGKNFRMFRDGVELMELPGGDIRVSEPQSTPSAEPDEDCLDLLMDEEPVLPQILETQQFFPAGPSPIVLVPSLSQW